MEHQVEFRGYLTNVRKSVKTGKAYAPKVVTDILRRCRLVEAAFAMELTEQLVDSGATAEICERIRLDRLGSTETTPYTYLSLINSVRIYDDFVAWRAKK